MTFFQPGFDRYLDDTSLRMGLPTMRDRLVVHVRARKLLPTKHLATNAGAELVCMGQDYNVDLYNFTRKTLRVSTVGAKWRLSTSPGTSITPFSSLIDSPVTVLSNYALERCQSVSLTGREKPKWMRELETPEESRDGRRLREDSKPYLNIIIPLQFGVDPLERDTYHIGQSFFFHLKVFL
jgi:hypothetical protein